MSNIFLYRRRIFPPSDGPLRGGLHDVWMVWLGGMFKVLREGPHGPDQNDQGQGQEWRRNMRAKEGEQKMHVGSLS